MTWNSTMGFISTVALFLPILSILLLRLGAYKTFPALLIYYSSVFIYNLFTEGFIRADRSVIHYWGISNNLLDIPLLLTFLIYFSSSNEFTKRIKYLIWGFILFEAIVVAIFGLNVNAITIILGPGIIIAIAFSMVFFIRQTKITIALDDDALSFFKGEARRRNTSYQRMIRNLVRAYAQAHTARR